MTDTVSVAIISAGSAVVIAIVTGIFSFVTSRRRESSVSEEFRIIVQALADCEAREHSRISGSGRRPRGDQS